MTASVITLLLQVCYKRDAVSHLGAGGRKIQEPGRSYEVEQLFVGFTCTCRNFGLCIYQVEQLLKMVGVNNKHEMITFQ